MTPHAHKIHATKIVHRALHQFAEQNNGQLPRPGQWQKNTRTPPHARTHPTPPKASTTPASLSPSSSSPSPLTPRPKSLPQLPHPPTAHPHTTGNVTDAEAVVSLAAALNGDAQLLDGERWEKEGAGTKEAFCV